MPNRLSPAFLTAFTGIIQNIILSLANFIIAPYLIIKYGQEALGVYGTILQIFSYAVLLDFGVSTALLNKLTRNKIDKDKSKYERYVVNGSLLLLLHNVLVAIVCFIGLNYIDILIGKDFVIKYEIETIIILFGFYALVRSLVWISHFELIATQKGSIINVVNAVTGLIKMFLILLLLEEKSKLIDIFAILYGIEISNYIIYNFINKKYLKNKIKISSNNLNKKNIKEILNFGIRYWPVNVSTIIQNSTDVIIVTILFGIKAASIYYSLKMFASVMYSLFGKIVDAYYPICSMRMAELNNGSIDNKTFLQYIINLQLYLSGFIGLTYFFGIEYIYKIVFPSLVIADEDAFKTLISVVLFLQCYTQSLGSMYLTTANIKSWQKVSLISSVFVLIFFISLKDTFSDIIMIYVWNFGLIIQVIFLNLRVYEAIENNYNMLIKILICFLGLAVYYFLFNFIVINSIEFTNDISKALFFSIAVLIGMAASFRLIFEGWDEFNKKIHTE